MCAILIKWISYIIYVCVWGECHRVVQGKVHWFILFFLSFIIMCSSQKSRFVSLFLLEARNNLIKNNILFVSIILNWHTVCDSLIIYMESNRYALLRSILCHINAKNFPVLHFAIVISFSFNLMNNWSGFMLSLTMRVSLDSYCAGNLCYVPALWHHHALAPDQYRNCNLGSKSHTFTTIMMQ